MDKTLNPKISVVMSVYNSGKYLAEAIDSVLKQSYKDFEFIIINDGSNDDSESIVKSFSDSRIKYFCNEGNRGLIYSLNQGVYLSSGEFIARMDADDVCDTSRFEKQIFEFQSDNKLVVCGSFIKTFGNGTETFVNYMPVTNAQILASVFFTCPFAHPSVMIKKQTLSELSEIYRTDYKHSEDYDLWSRLVFLGNSKNIPEYLLNYRVHDKQISTVFEEEKYKNVKKIQTNLLSKFNIKPSETESDFLLNLFKGISRRDKNYMQSGLRFLNTLHTTFAAQYPEYTGVMSQLLVSRWFKVCGNSGMGFLNLKFAFKLSFFRLKYLKFKDLIKLMYKTVINYTQLDKTK